MLLCVFCLFYGTFAKNERDKLVYPENSLESLPMNTFNSKRIARSRAPLEIPKPGEKRLSLAGQAKSFKWGKKRRRTK